MIGVLYHIPEVEKVLIALKSCLQPDGIIVVNEPQKGNPVIGLMRGIRKRVDPKYSCDQIESSVSELKGLFIKSGYKVRTFPQGILSTPLAESRIFPSLIGIPLALLFKIMDPVLEPLISVPILRNLSWNIVAEASIAND